MSRPSLRFPTTPLWVLSPALERAVVTVGIVAVLLAEQVEETAGDVREAVGVVRGLVAFLREEASST